MVFIQSHEYINTFGKPSKNIICLEGQTDYRISFNSETNKYDVTIVMGEYDKYLFSTETDAQCTKILQNIFNYHSTKDAFIICDVTAFMIPEMEPETTLEEVEDLMSSLLEFHGYKNVVDVWESKLQEVYDVDDTTQPVEAQPIITEPTSQPQIAMTPLMNNTVEQRYIHYN